MKKNLIAASAALLLGLSGVVLVAGPASAHNLALEGVAACQTDGTQTVTWTGTTHNVPAGDTGVATIKSHTPPSSSLSSNTVSGIAGNTTFTFTQTGIPGDTNQANVNLDIAWTGTDEYKQNDVTGHVKLNGSCVAPKTVPILPATFHPATCLAGSTFDVPVQKEDIKYTVDSPPVGDGQPLAGGATVTITAHVKASTLVENGGTNLPNSYTVTFTGQAQIYNATCVPAQLCTIGAPYHENDDNGAALSPDGLRIFSKGDSKATDGGGYSLSSGNAQGVTTFDYTKTGEVGNGIFFRLIFDLSADGGPGYASFSGLGTHVDQTTVAGYGSKAVFSGKTIADVSNTWPKNKLVAMIWQTGSSYANGDGAVLTGFSGYCGSGNFVPTVPATSTRVTDTNGEVVCNADGVGGGSYDETVTHYTTAPVWNTDTKSYDLVETIDKGYPVVTPHSVEASLELCPIHATPVNPTVKAVCDKDDTITLATTDNISYAITASDKSGATVTATPAEATVLDTAAGWTQQEDGTATFTVVYDNAACPIQLTTTPNGSLAITGSDPTNLIVGGSLVMFLGLITVTSVWAYRRRQALEDADLEL